MLRLMIEVKDFNAGQIEQELAQIEQRVSELFPEATLNIVGTTIQFSVIENYIAQGELISCIIALVVIGVLMMLVFQSVTLGLIGMIPNLTPVVVLGLMGYLNIPLDMMTMVVVPILLGLAVDDTIHFMNHSKLEFQRTGRYNLAIHQTFKTVGKAIFLTSFILIASFATYLTSITNFLFHLGLLLICGVLSALLADYFITPVLIAWFQPFGKE